MELSNQRCRAGRIGGTKRRKLPDTPIKEIVIPVETDLGGRLLAKKSPRTKALISGSFSSGCLILGIIPVRLTACLARKLKMP